MDREKSPRNSSIKSSALVGRTFRARTAILKALFDLGESAGATRIAEMLGASGIYLQERTIRFHLLHMDREGLTQCVTKREGRLITDTGRKELARCNVIQKVGFVGSKMDELGYRMSFDVGSGVGTVITNVAFINKNDLARSLHFMKPVFSSVISMGDRVAVRPPGGKIGGYETPWGKTSIATVCSMTVNGFFLKAGIPVISRFGGLVQMDHGTPACFLELIEYKGTTVDPHKLFIFSNMTRVGQYASSGQGIIGVSFREFPSVAYDKVHSLVHRLQQINMNGVLLIGHPNRPLLEIPVGDGRTGMIVVDGLNPFAAMHEAGIPVEIFSLAGLEEGASFVPFVDVASMGKREFFID